MLLGISINLTKTQNCLEANKTHTLYTLKSITGSVGIIYKHKIYYLLNHYTRS